MDWKQREKRYDAIFPLRNVHSINPNEVTRVRDSFELGSAARARYRSRNIDKSNSVTISELEERVREMVTAKREITSVPRVRQSPSQRGVEPIPVMDQLSPTH